MVYLLKVHEYDEYSNLTSCHHMSFLFNMSWASTSRELFSNLDPAEDTTLQCEILNNPLLSNP